MVPGRLLIVLVVILNSQLSPYFLDVKNLFRTSSDFMEIGLMMLPMVFIIVTGNIDLAVASTLGMTRLFHGAAVQPWREHLGCGRWLRCVLGLLAGLFNGTCSRACGFRRWWSPWAPTPSTAAWPTCMLGDQAARGYPEAFTYIGQGKLPGTLCRSRWCCFSCWRSIFGLVLHKTAFGRYLYAIGNNQNAASTPACRSRASRSSSSWCPA